jgi:hypothetical protein
LESVSYIEMLPTAASDLLTADVAAANAQASAGKVEAGYQTLSEGLHRAEDPRFANEPWTSELLRRYHEPIEQYSRTHGLP